MIQTENVLGKDFLVTFLRNVHVENALIKAILEKKFHTVKSVIESVVSVQEETILTHLFRTNYEKISDDQLKFTANFLTCIMKYPGFLTDFVFECDRHGKNIVYSVLGMDYIRNIEESLQKVCKIIENLDIFEDLAILSVFGSGKRSDRENLEKLLNVVEEGSEFHTRLVAIESDLGGSKHRRQDIDAAIRYKDNKKLDKMWKITSDSDMKAIMLIDEITEETLFHTMVQCEGTGMIDKCFDKLKRQIVQTVHEKTNETPLHMVIRCDNHGLQWRLQSNSNYKKTQYLLHKIKDYIGETVLKQILLKPSNYTISAIYEAIERKSDEKMVSKPCEYIFQWVQEYIGKKALHELIKETNTFSWFGDGVEKIEFEWQIRAKSENIRNYPEIAKELALKTNRFGQTTVVK